MTHCPNCGEPVEESQSLCPNCGADTRAVWPLPTGRQDGPFARLPEAPNATRSGFLIGLGIGGGWWYVGANVVNELSNMSNNGPRRSLMLLDVLLFGLPALLVGVAAILMRPSRPRLARGMGYSTIVMLAVMLGAFAICH